MQCDNTLAIIIPQILTDFNLLAFILIIYTITSLVDTFNFYFKSGSETNSKILSLLFSRPFSTSSTTNDCANSSSPFKLSRVLIIGSKIFIASGFSQTFLILLKPYSNTSLNYCCKSVWAFIFSTGICMAETAKKKFNSALFRLALSK